MSRIWRICSVFLVCCLGGLFNVAHAQSSSIVRLVVPYPAGGSADILARILQQPLQEQLKATVVVENRPGAGGRIAASQMKREPADGTVILLAPNALSTIASLVYADQLDYSMADFKPLSKLASYPFALSVPAESTLRSAGDFRDQARANPGTASYGTPGAGGMAHFSGVALGKAIGVELTVVPYRGGAPMLVDLMGTHVAAGIDTLGDHLEQHRAGKIRVLGILSQSRYALASDIPTLEEQGISMGSIEGWYGTFVPAATPAEVVSRLDQAFERILADRGIQDQLALKALETSYLSSAEFSKLQEEELRMWAPIVRDSGFKPN